MVANHRVTVNILCVALLVNAVFMAFTPPLWYALVPGVPETGPLNHHFVRDIGLAYFSAAVGLFRAQRGGGWKTAALGSLFVCLHSALHVVEMFMGQPALELRVRGAARRPPACVAVVRLRSLPLPWRRQPLTAGFIEEAVPHAITV